MNIQLFFNLNVCDAGPEIPDEDIGQIFDKFHRSRKKPFGNIMGSEHARLRQYFHLRAPCPGIS